MTTALFLIITLVRKAPIDKVAIPQSNTPNMVRNNNVFARNNGANHYRNDLFFRLIQILEAVMIRKQK